MRVILFIFLMFLQTNVFSQTIHLKNTTIKPSISDVTDQLNNLLDENYDTIIFDNGIYNVSEIYVKKPVVLIGKQNTTLKRLPNRTKFSRILTINGENYNNVVIKNIKLDGNLANQGDYTNYKLEQQHLIFISGKKNKVNRTKVLIENCELYNSAGDGITVFVNSDVVINNVIAKDIYRGALVSNGGNSNIKVNNFNILKGDIIPDSGIDFEVFEKGLTGKKTVIAELNDIKIQGKFQVGISDESFVKFNNVKTEFSDFYIKADNSTVEIHNSIFNINPNKKNVIYGSKNLLIYNSDFNQRDYKNSSKNMFLVMWMNKDTQYKNCNIIFKQCNFNTEIGNKSGSIFLFETDNLLNNNKLTLDNITYKNSNYLIETKRGGRFSLINTNLSQNYPFLLNYQKQNNRGLDIEIVNSKINQKLDFLSNKYNNIRYL